MSQMEGEYSTGARALRQLFDMHWQIQNDFRYANKNPGKKS